VFAFTDKDLSGFDSTIDCVRLGETTQFITSNGEKKHEEISH
jgi:hypothetical protein